jgi:hypothetical protein
VEIFKVLLAGLGYTEIASLSTSIEENPVLY